MARSAHSWVIKRSEINDNVCSGGSSDRTLVSALVSVHEKHVGNVTSEELRQHSFLYPGNGEVNEFVDANWNQVCVRGSEPDWRQGHNDSAAVAPAAFLVSYFDWALSWTEGTDRVVLLIGGYQHNTRNFLCGGPSLHLILQCSCLNLRHALCITQLFLPPQPLRKDKCLLSCPPGNISWPV